MNRRNFASWFVIAAVISASVFFFGLYSLEDHFCPLMVASGYCGLLGNFNHLLSHILLMSTLLALVVPVFLGVMLLNFSGRANFTKGGITWEFNDSVSPSFLALFVWLSLLLNSPNLI